jgi:ADP-heptose:LPS heptosyltransferase
MKLQIKLWLDYYVGGLLHVLLKLPTILLGKILRRDHDLSKCQTVTYLKMLGGGSLVIAYPSLLALRRSGIKKLQLVTSPSIRPFAEMLGIFDEIIVIRDNSVGTLLIDTIRTLRRLFGTDALVDLEIYSRLTTVFCLLVCAVNRVGFYTAVSFWRQGLATHLLYCNTGGGVYHFYDQVAMLFGARMLDLNEVQRQFRETILENGGRLKGSTDGVLRLAVAPCCSDLSRERMLQREEWVQILTAKLAGRAPESVEIHFLGGKADRSTTEPLGAALAAQLPGLHIHDHTGKLALRDSVCQLARMDMLYCIDSALLHYGRLLGVPTVSFWGPTSPAVLARPLPQTIDEIHYMQLPCSPCVHVTSQPPCAGNNICMRYAASGESTEGVNPVWLAND